MAPGSDGTAALPPLADKDWGPAQTPGRIPKVDPPQGSRSYTIGVLQCFVPYIVLHYSILQH